MKLLCEDNSIRQGYEQTVFQLANDFVEFGFCGSDQELIDCLSNMLGVDSRSLLKCFTEHEMPLDFEESSKRYKLFSVFVHLVSLKMSIKTISDINDESFNYTDCNTIRYIISDFESANSYLHEYRVLSGENQYENMLFDCKGLSYRFVPDMVQVLFDENWTDDANEMLLLFYRWFKYDISSKANSLYFFASLYLISDSEFLPTYIKDFAKLLIDKLKPLCADGKILSMQINNCVPEHDVAHRKSDDDTAAMQFVVGFDNYDSYYIRLDRAHKGQQSLHLNAGTPGEFSAGSGKWTKCFCFSSDEYQKVINNYPSFADYFIEHETAYNTVYFIKEKTNCNISKEDSELLSNIISSKAHEAFDSDITESDFDRFVYCLSLAMNGCLKHIDSDYTQEKKHFKHNRNIISAYLYILAFFGCGLPSRSQDESETISREELSSLIKKMRPHGGIVNLFDKDPMEVCCELDDSMEDINLIF